MNIRHLGSRTLGVIAVAAIAASMIGGCKNADAAVVGDWKDSKGQIVTFKADKTISQGTGAQLVAGKWSLSDKKVTMTIETIGGKPAEQFINDQLSQIEKINPKMVTPEIRKSALEEIKGLNFTLSDDAKTMNIVATSGKTPTGAEGTLTKVEAK